MKSTELRQLIRESINEYIRDIDEAGTKAGLQAKIEATEGAINKREKIAKMEGIDEAYHEMLDKGKMKEISGEVKALKKSLDKLKKQLDKLNSKSEPKTEVIKDEPVEEGDAMDSMKNAIVPEIELEENMDNEAYYEMAQQMKNNGTDYDSVVAKLEDMGLDNRSAEIVAMNTFKDEDMDIYEILSLQKRAGIISETEYKKKVNEIATKTQLFASLDKKNLSDKELNDLEGLKKLIDDILDKEYDTVADSPEKLAKEYIAKNKIEEIKKKPVSKK